MKNPENDPFRVDLDLSSLSLKLSLHKSEANLVYNFPWIDSLSTVVVWLATL